MLEWQLAGLKSYYMLANYTSLKKDVVKFYSLNAGIGGVVVDADAGCEVVHEDADVVGLESDDFRRLEKNARRNILKECHTLGAV